MLRSIPRPPYSPQQEGRGEQREQAELREYAASSDGGRQTVDGSLADKLRGASQDR